jgi:hypothetical protein
MYLNNITVEADDDIDDLNDIIAGITFLCGTTAGTYPLNRDFGIDPDIIGNPLPVATQLLEIEIREKIEQYEPRVEVDDISFSYDESGGVSAHIVISPTDEETDEDTEYDDMEEDEDAI